MASAAFKSVVSLFLDNVPIHSSPLTRRLQVTEYKNEEATVANGATYDIIALKSGSLPRVIVIETDGELEFNVIDNSAAGIVAFNLEAGGLFILVDVIAVVPGLATAGHMVFHNTSGADVHLSVFLGGD